MIKKDLSNFSLATAISLDVLELAILPFGIYVMYQGIEISHPIYAMLFANLIVPFAATVVNLVALVCQLMYISSVKLTSNDLLNMLLIHIALLSLLLNLSIPTTFFLIFLRGKE